MASGHPHSDSKDAEANAGIADTNRKEKIMTYSGRRKTWATTMASLATLVIALTGAAPASAKSPVAPAAQDGTGQTYSITLEADHSLSHRTFDVFEPIVITSFNTDGNDQNSSYSIDMKEGWLTALRRAAVATGLTTDGKEPNKSKSNVIFENENGSSSKAQVLDAISSLGEKTEEASKRQFATLLNKTINAAKYDPLPLTWKDGREEQNGVFTKTAVVPEAGWYLIRETTADESHGGKPPSGDISNSPVSLVVTNPVTQHVTIRLKSATPLARKAIVDRDSSGTVSYPRSSAIANENENITFELSFGIPQQWKDHYSSKGFWFALNDTLGKGLTSSAGPGEIKIGGSSEPSPNDVGWESFGHGLPPAPSPQIQKNDKTGETTLTWNFGNPQSETPENRKNLELAGKWVKIYYTAHLNNEAALAPTSNDNTLDVTYQHDPENTPGGEKTPPEQAHVFTRGFALKKIDGNSHSALAGAKFQIFDDKGTALAFTKDSAGAFDRDPHGKISTVETGNSGVLKFEGFANGIYHIRETAAPAGYRKLESDVKVTLAEKNGTASSPSADSYSLTAEGTVDVESGTTTIDIKNFKGFLPRTGSTGIMIFAAVGLSLLAVGIVALARQRRRV